MINCRSLALLGALCLTPALTSAQTVAPRAEYNEIELADQSRIYAGAEAKRKLLEEASKEYEKRRVRLERLANEVQRRYKALRLVQDELNQTLKRQRNSEDELGGGDNSPSGEERRAQRAREIRRLADQYSKMKPASAAGVIEVLMKSDEDLAVGIMKMMKPNKAGKIHNALKPDVSARLSELMASNRRGRRR